MVAHFSHDSLVVRPPRRALAAGAYVLLVAVFIVDARMSSHGGLYWLWYSIGVTVVGVAAVIARFRAGIVASPSGVRVKGYVFRHGTLLTWPEIEEFELGGYRRGLGARTSDGRWVSLMSYGFYEQSADALRHQLEEYRLRQQQSQLHT